MHFAEAQQKYRALEDELLRGELSEDEFLTQVAELRVLDNAGNRWRLSPRTGRWMVYDGQQWAFAEPEKPQAKVRPEVQAPVQADAAAEPESASPPAHVVVPAPTKPTAPEPETPTSVVPRLLMLGCTTLLVLACLFGGGIAAWVLLLRNVGEAAAVPTKAPVVAMRETYTPRPATATYTPTPTPTPSRTPTPTVTPIWTNTPVPTDTPEPTDTTVPTATWTPISVAPTRRPTEPSPTTAPTATSTAASTAVTSVASVPTSSPTTETASAQTYAVQQGDTLNEIADQFGVSPDALAQANGITDPALIRIGQVLVIPGTGTTASAVAQTQTYTVQRGDTLFGIALQFGVSANALAAANGISDPSLIRPGTVLVIPAPGTTPSAVTPSPTPTWTPIVVNTRQTTGTATTSTARGTSSPTPSSTPTRSGPTLTPQPTNTPRPAATPTPKPVALSGKLAFTVWNPHIGKYELYVSNIDGSGRNMLGVGFRQPQFRQDGNLLAVNGEGASNLEHLVTMNASGGEKTGVSNYAEDSFPAWSPDGAIVAFSSDSWGDGKTRLGIIHDMFGPTQEWIPMGNSQIEGRFPFWMADGRVVYAGCDPLAGGGNCGLYWVGAGGGGYHRLTTHESDTAPAGSGSKVAFMSARDGNWEVYVVDLAGGGAQRLTNDGAHDGLPTWSPDGRQLAFVSNRGGSWAIWVMNPDGSNQRKLFDLGGGYGTGAQDWTTERISWAP